MATPILLRVIVERCHIFSADLTHVGASPGDLQNHCRSSFHIRKRPLVDQELSSQNLAPLQGVGEIGVVKVICLNSDAVVGSSRFEDELKILLELCGRGEQLYLQPGNPRRRSQGNRVSSLLLTRNCLSPRSRNDRSRRKSGLAGRGRSRPGCIRDRLENLQRSRSPLSESLKHRADVSGLISREREQPASWVDIALEIPARSQKLNKQLRSVLEFDTPVEAEPDPSKDQSITESDEENMNGLLKLELGFGSYFLSSPDAVIGDPSHSGDDCHGAHGSPMSVGSGV